MRRREFVKGLAAAPIAMMVPRAVGSPDRSSSSSGNHFLAGASASANVADPVKRLNVVVHGSFAIVVDIKNKLGADQPYIYLEAPNVGDHSYIAQAFLPYPDANTGYEVHPYWANDYTPPTNVGPVTESLTGAQAIANLGPPRLGESQRLVITSNLSRSVSPIWSIKLPIPADIWPLRSTCQNYFDSSHGPSDTYHANEMFPGQHCAISYVLTYDKIPSGSVQFNPASGVAMDVPFDTNGVARLHFYAEPNTVPPLNAQGMIKDGRKAKQHLDMTLSAMDQLFDPTLGLTYPEGGEPDQPLGYVTPDDVWFKPSGNHFGVRVCEQLSLAERIAAQKSGQPCMAYLQTTLSTIVDQCSQAQEFEEEIRKIRELGIRSKKGKKVKIFVPPQKPPSNCMPLINNP